MSGRAQFFPSRRLGRGAALTFVFASVLVAGAATGSLPGSDRRNPADGTRSAVPVGHHADIARAAEEAAAHGASPLEAARRAVSRSGDRWAALYSPDEYEQFEDSLDGFYTGVGLWVRERDGCIEVTKAGSGTPAAKAGIRPGDRLRSIDGRRLDGRPVTEVIAMLRGDTTGESAGSTVRLGLERGTRVWHETVRRVRLSRDAVTVRALTPRVTVLRVGAFTKGSGEQIRTAVRKAPNDAGIILDLRGNAGGLVSEAVTAASAFLDGGLVATYDVEGEQRALHAESGGDTGRPLVVLVDGGTMSAAELLTGALQDRGRAVVVGSRTFGKGSVQMPTELPDGSVAELTVGHYRTPSGRDVDGHGLAPDLEAGERVLQRARTVLSGLGR